MSVINKLRIVSDGTPQGTMVYDADNTRITSPISSIDISITPENLVQATIVFRSVEIDVVAQEPSSSLVKE